MSATAAVVALLVALDAWLLCAHPLSRVSTPGLDRGEVFNAVGAYDTADEKPQLVLLGSSLVTAPFMQAEASFHGEPIPRLSHRRTHAFEKNLGEKLGSKPTAFCLAVGGEMASDAYLIAKHVLRGRDKPFAIVYGIAPRDFQDNLLPGVESSETFQILAGLDDLPELLSAPSVAIERKVNLVLGRTWALWRYKADLKTFYVLRIKKLMEDLFPFVVFDKYGPDLVLKPQKHGQFPEEAKGVPRAFPGVPLEHITSEQARFEYIKRYNPLSPSLIDAEFGYLERMLKLCRDEGVSVLIVNMPLSRFNLSLLPPGFYSAYKERVCRLCTAYGAEFADLNSSPWDDGKNFIDTVHLKPEMSAKFLETLADVTARSQASLALRERGRLAGRERGNAAL